MIRLLARLDGTPATSDLPSTSVLAIPGGPSQPVQGPSMGFQTPSPFSMPSIAPPRFSAPPVSANAAMSLFEQKSFERFVRLAPPRFDGISRYGAYDFLTECQDRLFNLGILEVHRVAYTSYQFTSMPKSGGGRLWPVGQLMLQR